MEIFTEVVRAPWVEIILLIIIIVIVIRRPAAPPPPADCSEWKEWAKKIKKYRDDMRDYVNSCTCPTPGPVDPDAPPGGWPEE